MIAGKRTGSERIYFFLSACGSVILLRIQYNTIPPGGGTGGGRKPK